MIFVVPMWQSNKCGSVRNDEIINLYLGSSVGPWVSIQENQEKTKIPEMKSNFQQIVLYYLGLCIQNPGPREGDLEPSPKRGSDKINV